MFTYRGNFVIDWNEFHRSQRLFFLLFVEGFLFYFSIVLHF